MGHLRIVKTAPKAIQMLLLFALQSQKPTVLYMLCNEKRVEQVEKCKICADDRVGTSMPDDRHSNW